MSSIFVTLRSGEEVEIPSETGFSLMETVRNAGYDELLALCGGCCSCATCHVYVDDAFVDELPEIAEDEDDLLDSSSYRRTNSRLACQIPVTPALDGIRIVIPPED